MGGPGDAQVKTPVRPAPDALARALSSYLAHLRVERGLAANSLAAYRRDLERYGAFLRARGVDAPAQVAPADVTAFAAALRQPVSRPGDRPADQPSSQSRPLAATSAARAVVAVRGWHRFLALEGLTPTDPAADVRPPRTPVRLPKAISIDEVERLLDACAPDATTTGTPAVLALRDRALLELLYATGARISEAVGLDVDDLPDLPSPDLPSPDLPSPDLPGTGDPSGPPEVGLLRLLGKGGKERLVPLGSLAAQALSAYLVRSRPVLAAAAPRGSGPALFLGQRGARMSRQSAWAVLRAAAERAGVGTEKSPVSPHTLRHSFATHLLTGGADIRVVQELLGHASVTTTQVYTLVTVEALREVYATSHPRARAAR